MKWTSLILALILSAGCGKQEPPQVQAAKAEPEAPKAAPNEVILDANMRRQAQVEVATVVSGSLPVTVQVNGRITVNENRSWHVGAITDGRIVRVDVNVGDVVKKDQVLAGMHSHDIHEARASFRKAQADLIRLKSAASFALKQRDRYKRLHDLKAASLEQLEHAETELKSAEISVENAETEVGRTRRHIVEFLGLGVEDHDEHQTGDTDHAEDLIPVKAPAAGVIIERKVSAGSVAGAGDELFEISDLTSVWMVAAVNEEHIGKLRIGLPVRVTVQAYPDSPFLGRITRFGDRLDPDTRTVPVRVELGSAGGRLKPEMYATAEIQLGSSEPTLFVPHQAVQQVNGQPAVFIERESGHFEARLVQPGRELDGQIQIVEGVRTGERVVIRGSYVLKSQMLKGSLGE